MAVGPIDGARAVGVVGCPDRIFKLAVNASCTFASHHKYLGRIGL